MSFEAQLKKGKIGESQIANWFKGRNFAVLPVYEIEKNQGKGPQLFFQDKSLIAPDMLIFKAQKEIGSATFWIEAKHKEAFSWHRISKSWVTGIDIRHYEDYCHISKMTPFPVWLLFLQRGGHAKDSPKESPSGLYGNELTYLARHENHRHGNWGKSGMVYWSIDHLKKLADLREVLEVQA